MRREFLRPASRALGAPPTATYNLRRLAPTKAPRSPRPGRPRSPRAPSPGPTGNPASYASTPFTRATSMVSRGCITSTPSTRSHSTSTSAASRPSPNAFSSPCSKRTSRRIPFQSRDSTPTMAPSTSTNGSRRFNKLHIGEARQVQRQRPRRGQERPVVRKHLVIRPHPPTLLRPGAFTRVLSPFQPHRVPHRSDHKGKIKKRYRDQDIATPYGAQIPSQCRDVPQTRRHLPTSRCHRLCPKRPRRRPRSQCRPRRTVPNHRIRHTPPRNAPLRPNNPQPPVAHPPIAGRADVPSPPLSHRQSTP